MRENSLTATINSQEWLKPAEESVQNLIHKAFAFTGGQSVKNLLHGTWLGHPVHVILTDVPLGAWTAALVFDALEQMDGGRAYRVAADASVAIGLAGAVGAAVTGMTDWQDIDPPARRIGLIHGVLNLASAALYGGSLIARRGGSRSTGRGLAALGFAVSTLAAYLGGNMIYEHKIGVDHTTPEKLPEEFARIAAETDLEENTPTRADYNGVPILLVRRGSQIYALAETCSHLGGPLSEGKLEGEVIQCPWHGSRFSIHDGHVVDGPAVHAQPCLETRVRNGEIQVRRSDCQSNSQASEKKSVARAGKRRRTGTSD